MRDPRRWLLLLVIAAAIALLFARRGPVVKAPHDACLTHADCLKAERCYVVPAEDGFATFGLCADRCTDDAQCDGLRCVEAAAGASHAGPLRAAKDIGPGRERLCVKVK